MIVNEQNEVITCRLPPRDIVPKALSFATLPIHRCPLCVSISLSGTEQNGKT